MRRAEPPHLRMTKGLQFVIVELEKFIKEVNELEGQREAWCWFLKNSKELTDANKEKELKRRGKDMGEAIKRLWKLSADEYLREQAEAEDKFKRDHEESLYASYDKGRSQGREEEKGTRRRREKRTRRL